MIKNKKKLLPKFGKNSNPKIGLVTLSTDLRLEKDFYSVCGGLPVDIFVNRIHNQNPLNKKNLKKMYSQLKPVTEKILPGQRINTIAYGCTSGTIAIGEEKVKRKIQLAKRGCYVSTPITSAIKAFKTMKIKKIALFTPYSSSLNKTILEYFKKKKIEVISFASFNLNSDSAIGKIDKDYLYKVLINMDIKGADALFVSCTALPALDVIDKVEKKKKINVLSSNQTLVWDCLRSVKLNIKLKNYGRLLNI